MFALCNPNMTGLLQGEHPYIWAQSHPPPVDLSVGAQIAAEWLQIAQRSQWKAYRKPPSLFRMVPSLTPSPKMGVPYDPRYANGHISATDDPIHFTSRSRVGFRGRRIEWRYFRLHQIQVGGRPPSSIISNGNISATAHSIHLYSVIARSSLQ